MIKLIVKNITKKLLTWFNIKKNKIISGNNDYIGFNVKIVNRGSIKLGDNVIIRPMVNIYAETNTSLIDIGYGTEIGQNSCISCINKIVFGKNVLTGPHIFITDHNHEYENPEMPISKQGIRCHPFDRVFVDDGSWLGTNVVIVGNVYIGKNCVIGANSVVTKDIPDFSVAAGIPCKVLKKFNFNTHAWETIK